jgi:hypothetical protein
MPALSIPESNAQDIGFAARRNRDTNNSAALRTNYAIKRLHIRTARFPTSFSGTDETLWPVVRSKSAYYPVIAGVVASLPHNTRDARMALYDRAEIALTAELLQHPEISDEQVAIERLAFEKAILKVEGDARKKEKARQAQKKQRLFELFLSSFRIFRARQLFYPVILRREQAKRASLEGCDPIIDRSSFEARRVAPSTSG